MRPAKLELEGFASFRERTELDLAGAELFVLSGQTGAGKSSLIDAMVFSLYGSVPRYDDRRLVAPVISQGHQQARVRFTFEVGGERLTATRVVRRTKTGATTKEARLERESDGEVLAGTADELSTAVERLIGLRFEHFTRTVVLPQGEFQEFLHAKPKERQDLLVELLDLDVYRRIAQRARERGAAAGTTAEVLRERLAGDLADASEDAVGAAARRVTMLTELAQRCEAATPRLEALIQRGKDARRRADTATDKLAAVEGVAIPDGVDELHTQVEAASTAVATAEKTLAAARARLEAAESAADGLPSIEALQEIAAGLERRRVLAGKLAEAKDRAASATTKAAEQRRTLEQAVAEEKNAARERRRLEHRHLAHTLRDDLEVGGPCPVCDQPVTDLAGLEPTDSPAELAAAHERLTAAERAVETARASLDAIERAATSAATSATQLEEQLEELDHSLAQRADALDVELDKQAIAAQRQRGEQAKAAVAAARDQVRAAEHGLREAQQRRASLSGHEREAWAEFDRTRDRLAGALAPEAPPAVDRDNLADSWGALLDWVNGHRPAIEEAAATAKDVIDEAERAYRAEVDELLAAVEAADVEPDGPTAEHIARAVTAELATARAAKQRAEERLEQADTARKQLAEAERDAALANELGKLLNARNFEQWLLNRALQHLVVGASTILRELTNDAYSLKVAEDGSFAVIDHRNADEERSARTLSGGETFLASLALALSLAEHVAELATRGSGRLEALFLDEGFGTLDAETLDTVAAAIEELGSQGRMVGLVTHVRDLAERVPVRFEVRRTAVTSTVERIER